MWQPTCVRTRGEAISKGDYSDTQRRHCPFMLFCNVTISAPHLKVQKRQVHSRYELECRLLRRESITREATPGGQVTSFVINLNKAKFLYSTALAYICCDSLFVMGYFCRKTRYGKYSVPRFQHISSAFDLMTSNWVSGLHMIAW